MYQRSLSSRIILFIIGFSVVYFLLHATKILPLSFGVDPQNNFPWLFSVIGVIFSIVSGFIIQSKWVTWNELIDATHGEISSLKQLHMFANHFPVSVQHMIREDITTYLSLIISETSNRLSAEGRSETVETAIYKLEETVLDIDYSQHPNIGALAFNLVRQCLEYREKRLQNVLHKLPIGVRLYIISATVSLILSALLISIKDPFFDYLFTLIIGLLAYSMFLLIDDLDHPYRPGQWQLTRDGYSTLLREVQESMHHPTSHKGTPTKKTP